MVNREEAPRPLLCLYSGINKIRYDLADQRNKNGETPTMTLIENMIHTIITGDVFLFECLHLVFSFCTREEEIPISLLPAVRDAPSEEIPLIYIRKQSVSCLFPAGFSRTWRTKDEGVQNREGKSK